MRAMEGEKHPTMSNILDIYVGYNQLPGWNFDLEIDR